MTEAFDSILEQAYDLIQQDSFDDAMTLLQPFVDSDTADPDLWWLWAMVVEQPEDARLALQKVIELDPSHSTAHSMLGELETLHPALPVTEDPLGSIGTYEDFDSLLEESDGMTPPEMLPDDWPGEPAVRGPAADDADDMPDFLKDEPAQQPARRSILRTVLLILLIAVIGVGGALIVQRNRPAAIPVEVATEAPVVLVEPSDTLQTVVDAIESAANTQRDLLGGEASVKLNQIADGIQMILMVCRPAGSDMQDALNVAMETAARYSVTVQDELASVGAELVNCSRDDVLISASLPAAQAVLFANGEVDQIQFRAGWEIDG